MAFDWPSFLRSRRIDYATSGRNVAKGAIAIKCPFCGPADPSEHLVIRLNGQGWWCWRNRGHRGAGAAYLVSRLIGCSLEQAASITDEKHFIPEGDFLENVTALLQPKEAGSEVGYEALKLPEEFKPIEGQRTYARLYQNYMVQRRGFSRDDFHRMKAYDIHYCVRGPYSRRIMFPVYFMDDLVGWTGRAIDDSAFIRYKTLSYEKEKADLEGYKPALGKINSYLLWFDLLVDRVKAGHLKTLIISEGPMDGLKLNILGRQYGVGATCLFTSSPTDDQKALLYELAPMFEERYIMLDRNMEHQAYALRDDLTALRFGLLRVPPGLKDPGELSDIRQLRCPENRGASKLLARI